MKLLCLHLWLSDIMDKIGCTFEIWYPTLLLLTYTMKYETAWRYCRKNEYQYYPSICVTTMVLCILCWLPQVYNLDVLHCAGDTVVLWGLGVDVYYGEGCSVEHKSQRYVWWHTSPHTIIVLRQLNLLVVFVDFSQEFDWI